MKAGVENITYESFTRSSVWSVGFFCSYSYLYRTYSYFLLAVLILNIPVFYFRLTPIIPVSTIARKPFFWQQMIISPISDRLKRWGFYRLIEETSFCYSLSLRLSLCPSPSQFSLCLIKYSKWSLFSRRMTPYKVTSCRCSTFIFRISNIRPFCLHFF